MNKQTKAALKYTSDLQEKIKNLEKDIWRKDKLLQSSHDELFYNDQNTGSEWLINDIFDELNKDKP